MLSSIEQDILTVFSLFKESVTGSSIRNRLNEVRILYDRPKCLCGSFYPVTVRLCDTEMLARDKSKFLITEKGR